jgi:uncharacterized cupredoxin-like copper-binding protein
LARLFLDRDQGVVAFRSGGTSDRIENEPRNREGKVDGPGTLPLHIKNVSSMEHNFTLKNPEGEIIKSVNLPEGETVTVEIDLPRPGTYPFYCDRPFHASLGMKGVVKVVGR